MYIYIYIYIYLFFSFLPPIRRTYTQDGFLRIAPPSAPQQEAPAAESQPFCPTRQQPSKPNSLAFKTPAAGYPASKGLRMLKWLYAGYTPYAVRWVPALLECLCGAARGTTGLFVK